MNKLSIREMQKGHKFSELSHYTLVNKSSDVLTFRHHGSGKEVRLAPDYVKNYLKNAEQYQQVVEVGREDKFWTEAQIRRGIANKEFSKRDAPEVGSLRQLGIRTIWENIHSAQVFTVCYGAKSKETARSLSVRRQDRAEEISDKIQISARMSKRAVREAVEQAAQYALDNPIVKESRERVLRGYKVQFTSRDGRYDCVDMDLGENNNIRPVNINTLKWLVFDGVKYEVTL